MTRAHGVKFWNTLLGLLVATSLVVAVVGAAVYFAVSTRNGTANDLPQPRSTSPDNLETNEHDGLAPLFITTMTHMEGSFHDDVDEELFNRHVSQMRDAMDVFDEYSAKLTFETEQSFAEANTTWDLNILQEVIEREHGVGTHADFGATSAIPLGQYIRRF
ncbi:MAG: hypothetical protein NUV56_00085, partial [Candidatus Uhrbacteria bacterium]|nr:hypothetical protein [Candidatus Uhrbacteria bacterium]